MSVRGGGDSVLGGPPLVDLGLQAGPGGEEFGVARGEAAQKVGQPGEEGGGIEVQTGEDVVHEERVKGRGEVEAGREGVGHEGAFSGARPPCPPPLRGRGQASLLPGVRIVQAR